MGLYTSVEMGLDICAQHREIGMNVLMHRKQWVMEASFVASMARLLFFKRLARLHPFQVDFPDIETDLSNFGVVN